MINTGIAANNNTLINTVVGFFILRVDNLNAYIVSEVVRVELTTHEV